MRRASEGRSGSAAGRSWSAPPPPSSIAGALLNIFCQNAWQRGVAVAALLGGIAWGFALLAVPPEAPEHEDGQRGD